MTTHQYSHQTDHSTDAGFRAWVGAMMTALDAIGMVRTVEGSVRADGVVEPATTQFDLATIIKSTSPGGAVHEMRRMPDTFAGGPDALYLRFSYGNAGVNTTYARIQITPFRLVNGAWTPLQYCSSLKMEWPIPAAPRDWYFCFSAAAGAFAFVADYNTGATAHAAGNMAVLARSVDQAGVVTNKGLYGLARGQYSSSSYPDYCFMWAKSLNYGWTQLVGSPQPLGSAFSFISSTTQNDQATAFTHFCQVPETVPTLGCFSSWANEFGYNSHVDIALTGEVPHRYKVLNESIGLTLHHGTLGAGAGTVAYTGAPYPAGNNALPSVFAMIWE